MRAAVVHDFAERLEHSLSLSDEADWVEFYRRIWPDMLLCARIDADSRLQRLGVDRMIMRGGHEVPIYVDEKKRDKDFGDVLLEEWSVFYGDGHPRNVVGWALDSNKVCNYVAYAVLPARRCYLLPFEVLRLAFKANAEDWKRRRGAYPKDAPNNGYVTRNVAVQWPELKAALCQQMHRRFGSTLELPVPRTVGEQTLFDWSKEGTSAQR